MQLEDIPKMEATHTEIESVRILASITCKDDWVYYRYNNEPLTLYLIRRYLAMHGRNFGILTETMTGSVRPVGIIRYRNLPNKNITNITNDFLKAHLVEGVFFLNGAVVRISYGETEEHILFVSKEDTEFWGYPDTGKSPSVFNENKFP